MVILHTPLTGRTPRVLACSALALRRGVRRGQPLTEARALAETAEYVVDDPVADREALRRLAPLCETYTPLYGLEEAERPESLLLDVTGCAGLFGGEQALAERIQEDWEGRGWRVRVGVAPTIGAAWAVAHGISRSNQAVVVPATDLEETLDPLSVGLLRIPEGVVRSLSELGVHGIGQLRRLPRNQLPSRWGSLLLQRLDQALGRAAELIAVESPAQPLVATWAGQEPFRDREVLLEVFRRLLRQLLAPLMAQRRGVRRIQCQLRGESGRPLEFTIGLVAPSHSVERIEQLMELQLERLAWDQEVAWVRLDGVEVAPLGERPRDLFGDWLDEDQAREMRWLLERLSNRLGAEAVVRANCLPDPQPEWAVTYEPWLRPREPRSPGTESGAKSAATTQVLPPPGTLPRPLRLLAEPQRLETRGNPVEVPRQLRWPLGDYETRQAWGPERIEAGWWRGEPIRRDYYRVETVTGERFWLFRCDAGWFLHGCFD